MNMNPIFNNRRHPRRRRRAVTLLEMVIAGTMLAMVMSSLSVVFRASRVAWSTSQVDTGSMQHAHAVVRHFVRQCREAREVVHLSANRIELQMRNGERLSWEFTGPGGSDSNQVLVRDSALNLESTLAVDIADLRFIGREANLSTQATDPSRVHLVTIEVAVDLNSDRDRRRWVKSHVWIRSW